MNSVYNTVEEKKERNNDESGGVYRRARGTKYTGRKGNDFLESKCTLGHLNIYKYTAIQYEKKMKKRSFEDFEKWLLLYIANSYAPRMINVSSRLYIWRIDKPYPNGPSREYLVRELLESTLPKGQVNHH